MGPDNAEFPLGFDINNVGHSPAYDVDLFFEVRPYGFAERMPIDTLEFCDLAKVSPNMGPGYCMPPDGKPYLYNRIAMVPTSQIIKSAEADSSKRFWVVVVGCATYRSIGDQHMHQIPFTFELNRWLPENPRAMKSFRYQPGAIFYQETLRFLLGPATVALALPIYINAGRIRGAALGIFAGVTVGGAVARASVVVIAWLLGAPNDLLRSIAPKSVTTPIAIGISEQINGHPSLTSVLVITSGIIGAMLSGRLYDWIGIHDWEAHGLATGIALHGIGTAQMLSVNETAGAFAGLAIGLTGLFTAIILPIAIHLL